MEGSRDPVTGLVVNLTDVEKDLQQVVGQLDHRHLAFDVPAFADKVPTLENLGQFCFQQLSQRLGKLLAGIRLKQGEDDWVDVWREAERP